MPKQVRLRRGTTAQHATFTGADGEVTFDSTKKVLVVHDGVTAGGKPLEGFVFLSGPSLLFVLLGAGLVAKSAPRIPARTSPVPAVASAVELGPTARTSPCGSAMSVVFPLSMTIWSVIAAAATTAS